MSLQIEGFVEIEAGLFSPGVLEDAFQRFVSGGDPKLTYGRRPFAVLGRVTKISGRGDKVLVGATIETEPRSELRDVENKVRSGTIKCIGIDGQFSPDHAVVSSFNVAPVMGVPGTGFITAVGPSS